jgi:hypothetical protein
MFGKSSSRQAPGLKPGRSDKYLAETSIRRIIAKNCIRFNLPAATGAPRDARPRCGACREEANCRRMSRRRPVPDLARNGRRFAGQGMRKRGLPSSATEAKGDVMSRFCAAAVVLLMGFWPGSASAQPNCVPYCDFNHDYGPRDFTWAQPGGYGPQQFIYVRPGLFLHPACGPSGYCSPYLLSSSHRSGVRVTIRRLGRPVPIRP